MKNAKRAYLKITTGLQVSSIVSYCYSNSECENKYDSSESLNWSNWYSNSAACKPVRDIVGVFLANKRSRKYSHIITTSLWVNDGKIISGTLRNITTFTIETETKMEIQIKY